MQYEPPLYKLTGTVVHGLGNGHTVGMPTANLPCPAGDQHPPFGVYASIVEVDGMRYIGVTNVGSRPSVDSSPTPTVETWLLDYTGNLYGKQITVGLMRFLRPTVKMESLQAVREQVQKDAEAARRCMSQIKDSADGSFQ